MSSHKFVDGTELGLPAGVCVRCATLQDPVPQKCETEQLPKLTWLEPSSILHMLCVDGLLAADVLRTETTGLWSWSAASETWPELRGEDCGFATVAEAKHSCERFVLANLSPKSKAAP